MGISDRIRQLNEQHDNERRAYCEVRDSLPWVHREASRDYVYGEELKAPFEGAVPFGVDAKGGVHPAHPKPTYKIDKDTFYNVKKPFLNKKKPIFKTVYWVYHGKLYSKDFGRTIEVGKNQKYGHRILSQSIVPFIDSWNMFLLYNYLKKAMPSGTGAADLKFKDLGNFLNVTLQQILDKISSAGYTRYEDKWKVPSVKEINAASESDRKYMIPLHKAANEGLDKALQDIGAKSNDGVVVQVGEHNHYKASIY